MNITLNKLSTAWFPRGFLLLLLASCFLTSCSQQPTDSPSGSSSSSNGVDTIGKPRVALVMKSLANEFFRTMEQGARQHQVGQGGEYELITNGIKDELDTAGQIALVEQMIAQRVNAIVIAPADSKALVSVCKKALDAGITVINIDNKLDAAVLAGRNIKVPYVGPENRKGARLAGEFLAAKLKAADKVAIIEGAPNAFNGIERKTGFEEAMRSANINIATSQSANWETARANQLVASIITNQPDIKAFLCANDSMALGAVAALRAAGKLKEVFVIGFDNITAVQSLIRDGQMLATVEQHGDRLAVYGIEYALEVMKNKSTPADRETPVEVVTAANLK